MGIDTLEKSKLPSHVAIIMDGNGRWAKTRGKKRVFGHKVGVERAREMVECCARLGIEALTLFAFSSENWRRPAEEVSFLMELFVNALAREVKQLHKNNVRLRFLGDTGAFNEKLQNSIAQAEQKTQYNTGLKLNIAANYGGRWDILNACKKWAQHGGDSDTLNEAIFESYLSTAGLPPLDLMIRTGGEFRISNFLIWQAAYAELYFSPKLWPDFDQSALYEALEDYAGRQRRFGKTGEQVGSD